MIKPKVVLLIFVSSKIVLTGAKVYFSFLRHEQLLFMMEWTVMLMVFCLLAGEEIYAAFNRIYTVFCEFRCLVSMGLRIFSWNRINARRQVAKYCKLSNSRSFMFHVSMQDA